MSLARKYQYEEIGEIREEPVTFQMMLLEPEDLVDAVNIAEPVSYTHLDVYKRQALYC